MGQERRAAFGEGRAMMSAASGSASLVGADLREARERLGWTVADIAAHLRIRLPYLEAIEDGRTADLPGNAYAVGFVRTYGQALGLDPDEVARRFRAEAADVNRKTELAFPAPVPERGVPALALVLVGLVLAAGAYAGWYRYSGNARPASEPVQEVPERLASLAPPPAPPPASPLAPPSMAPAAVAAPGAPVIATPSAPMSMPTSGPVPQQAGPTQSGVPLAVSLAGPITSTGITAAPDAPRIVLRAKVPTWIQVRDPTGPVLIKRVLTRGESWPVPAKPLLLLSTEHPQGLELLVDGTAAPPIPGDNSFRRDLPLDPDVVKEGKLGASAPRRSP